MRRYVWASPNSLIGLLFLPSAVVTKGGLHFVDGVLELHSSLISWVLRNLVPMPGGAVAITLGHVVLGRDAHALARTRAHERVHVRQYERWGPAFIPAYVLASLWGLVTRTGVYHGNAFERAAFHVADFREPVTTLPSRMQTPRRSVALYLGLLVVTVALGLATRRYPSAFPVFVASYGGDALWAAMILWLAALVRPGAPTLRLAFVALVISTVVELSQLYHAPWIDAVRTTRVGALALGQGFLWSDLLCYAVGVALAAALDAWLHGPLFSRSIPSGSATQRSETP